MILLARQTSELQKILEVIVRRLLEPTMSTSIIMSIYDASR